MAKLRLKYVNQYLDGTGKMRRYFRRGQQRSMLPGEVGSEEFMEAYQACLAQQAPAPPRSRRHPDSLGRWIEDFYSDRTFKDLKPGTRAAYKSALDAISEKYGSRSALKLDAEAAEKIISKIGETKPGMANLTRAAMRRVFKMAVKKKRRADNPFLGIEAYSLGEHHTWTEAELAQYEAKWRLGTRERLAFDLLLYTGQRVGDVSTMKRTDIVDGMIHVVQQKTGAELWLPILPPLARSMAACPNNGLTLFGDAAGRPVKRAAISHIIRQAVRKADLPSRCVAHGLRKARMRRLAEGGATGKEIAGWSGHKTLKEVERYTEAADQKRLAMAAAAKMVGEQ